MSNQAMQPIMVVETEIDATFIKGMLEDHGIAAIVTGLEGSALGASLDGEGEIRICVKPIDMDEAKALIAQIQEDDGEVIPEWTCQCGQLVDEGFAVCWSCEAEYPSNTNTDGTDETK